MKEFTVNYVIFISILFGYSSGQFSDGVPKSSAEGVMYCGAVVAQCLKRCSQRAEAGVEGTQYVQWTVYYRGGKTSCTTEETEKDELVSANPPNSISAAVVFNVPCCQQRGFDTPTTTTTTTIATNPGIAVLSPASQKTIVPRNLLPLITENTTKKTCSPVFIPITQKTISGPEEMEWHNVVLLVISVLCFLLLLIILTLMVCKIMKKKRGKTLKAVPETSPATNNNSNGAVLMGVISGTKQDKTAREVVSNMVRNISPPPSIKKDDAQGHVIQSKDRKGSQDYIVLETMSTPPKSVRSNRPRGLSGKSEEVMIVGRGSRKKDYQSTGIPNGHVGNFYSSGSHLDAQSPTSTSPQPHISALSSTIQPQLPGRNLQNKLQNDVFKRRSDSLPHAFDVENETEYDKVDRTIINGNHISKERQRNNGETMNTAELRAQGTTSLDRLNSQHTKNIYNCLREENTQDSDYQRLNREDKIQITNSTAEDPKVGNNHLPVTTNEKSTKKNSIELNSTPNHAHSTDDEYTDGYVTEFQILNTPPLPKDNKTGYIPQANGDVPTSDYIDAPLPKSNFTGKDIKINSIVAEIPENHINPIFSQDIANEKFSVTRSGDNILKESEEL